MLRLQAWAQPLAAQLLSPSPREEPLYPTSPLLALRLCIKGALDGEGKAFFLPYSEHASSILAWELSSYHSSSARCGPIMSFFLFNHTKQNAFAFLRRYFHFSISFLVLEYAFSPTELHSLLCVLVFCQMPGVRLMLFWRWTDEALLFPAQRLMLMQRFVGHSLCGTEAPLSLSASGQLGW